MASDIILVLLVSSNVILISVAVYYYIQYRKSEKKPWPTQGSEVISLSGTKSEAPKSEKSGDVPEEKRHQQMEVRTFIIASGSKIEVVEVKPPVSEAIPAITEARPAVTEVLTIMEEPKIKESKRKGKKVMKETTMDEAAPKKKRSKKKILPAE